MLIKVKADIKIKKYAEQCLPEQFAGVAVFIFSDLFYFSSRFAFLPGYIFRSNQLCKKFIHYRHEIH
jgi:hypothetical protein